MNAIVYIRRNGRYSGCVKRFLPAILSPLLLLSTADRVKADVIDVSWDGGTAFGRYDYAFNWLPRIVPNNGNGGNTYRVTIGNGGPALEFDTSVDALTIKPGGAIGAFPHSFSSAFTRNDSSPFALSRDRVLLPAEGIFVGGQADLGVLANFNAATSTLEGGSYSVGNFAADATISFQGARIVKNGGGIRIWGGGGKITDEFGNDALRSLAVNNGVLDLTTFETAGDFTNNGELNLISHDILPRTFVVTGKLTNFNPATKTLTGGRYVLDPRSAATTLRFRGADIVTNASDLFVTRISDGTATGAPAIVDENGNDALRNFADNAATGRLTFNGFGPPITTTARRVTNAGYMNLHPRFDLPTGGMFEQFGGELEFAIHPYFAGIDTHGGSFHLHGGRLTGRGTLIGSTFSNAVIAPGNNNYEALMSFEGDLVLGSGSVVRFDIKGTARGPGAPTRPTSPKIAGYDAINSSGIVAIDGKLQVTAFILPSADNTFVVMQAQAPITGSFLNVANGARLTTTDGRGTFIVNYGPNSVFDSKVVVLSAFELNTKPPVLLNLSTRGSVTGGERAMIGGFIITGSEPKPVLLRAIGPTLRNFGVAGPLEDPTLALHDHAGATIASNDDWQHSAQWTDIQSTGIAPTDGREAAIMATLAPGSYTAVLDGKNGASGIALVEIYDLDASTQSQLANLSTRGYAASRQDPSSLIGGMIIAGGSGSTDILVRGLGPSLGKFGVTAPLEDPYLYLRKENGSGYDNDDWRSPRESQAAVLATGIPPTDDREAALVATLQPAAYTAHMFPTPFKDETSNGVGLIEFYRVR